METKKICLGCDEPVESNERLCKICDENLKTLFKILDENNIHLTDNQEKH